MAKKKPMTAAEATATCEALGIDVSKWDLAKIMAFVQALLSLFSQPKPTPALEAAPGCEEDHACCFKVAGLAGQTFQASLEMLQEHCK